MELNHGPNKNSQLYFSCCHWNVNILEINYYCKAVALKAQNSIYNYDFIYISQTFLNSSFKSDNKSLMLECYNLTRSDEPLFLLINSFIPYKGIKPRTEPKNICFNLLLTQ